MERAAHSREVARGSPPRRVLVSSLALVLGGALAAGAGACVKARSPGPDEAAGWFAFDPAPDAFAAGSGIDLRPLNERFAGENGFVGVRDEQFIHAGTGQPLRFWAVNLPLTDFKDPRHQLEGDELRTCARLLAKHGVNMVRIHVGYFDDAGHLDLARVRHAIRIVEAMKAEGIYTHFSTYYPLWLRPRPGTPWLQGYDGTRHPFAALFFNRAFQAQYRAWWTALLTTPSPTTGRPLVEEPAVASLEMQNEDSLFFWTFGPDQVPDAQLRILEAGFGEWLVKRFGSLEAAFARWNGTRTSRDAPAEGRVGFRPLRNMVDERTPRDRDTARFLLETQARFYAETHAFLRALGFRGPIAASNWKTASAQVLDPLEKLSYTAGDFIDRHGYFGCDHQGPAAEWSLRSGHTYSDRSALRFDAEGPGKPERFWNPAMDPHYGGKPSMISETTWERPNRFRSEAPLYYAVYGALQHSDAIVHFALDGCHWSAKPNRVMQPWTLMTPAMMGQFPAAALIFRRGLVGTGEVLAGIDLNQDDLVNLEGTPQRRLDPLLPLAGRAEVTFTTSPTSVRMRDLRNLVDRAEGTVVSSTGELKLDYGKGVLTIDAARAQGVSGLVKAAGTVETRDLVIASDLELGHIVAVATDDLPLARSGRILLQVMSEERPTGYRTQPAAGGTKRIDDTGRDPWLVRDLTGTVRFKRADAAALRVTALDFNGYPAGDAGTADHIALRPKTVYYSIDRPR